MILALHPHGNANVRAVLRALHREKLLSAYFTTLGFSKKFAARFPAKISRHLLRRAYDLPAEFLHTHPFQETVRLGCLRLGWRSLIRHEQGPFCVDAVWQALDRSAARFICAKKSPLRAVYGYEDGSLETFRAAKSTGLVRLYDQPVGYYPSAQKIFAEERELSPEWAPTIPGLADSAEKLARKAQELELADIILACSPFVHRTLLDAGIEESRIRRVQFGSPENAPPHTGYSQKGPLRILFAGRIGQRKGLSYLLQAVARFPRSEVTLSLLGEFEGPREIFSRYSHLFTHLSPRPQPEVFEQMAQHDLFILPSLFEGQALAVLEAMRCGLPVIVTPNTGASEVVQEGVSGFVVPIRSAEAIGSKIEFFLKNRSTVASMGQAARARAEATTWRAYEDQIISIVHEALSR